MTATALKHDFSGYATKANLKCTDGRTIKPQAFQHMDGLQVPLVWMHGRNNVENVLGHAVLEARADGMYCKGFFNDTPNGQVSKRIVKHGDVKALSIYANQLAQNGNDVVHGQIREVSLVLAGANPGAFIDNVTIKHGADDYETLDNEAVISANLELDHVDEDDDDDEVIEHATVREVYESMPEEYKEVLHLLLAEALDGDDAEHSDENDDNPGDDADNEGGDAEEGIQHMNVFDQDKQGKSGEKSYELTHADVERINELAHLPGYTMRRAAKEVALEHGITNLEILFPDAKNITNTPEWIKRQTEWVAGVLSSTRKTPFSRIKSTFADLTQDEARAKGYIKGSFKKEEWFSVTHRTTGPTTVYKKQKLDRDDIIDITDFDVVAWMKVEMRLMLEEEVARAILIGDGREVDDEDKIKDPMAANDGDGIRSILHEHELFVVESFVNIDDANSSMMEVVDQIIMDRQYYKGTGTPTFYTTENVLAKLLVQRDAFDKRQWPTVDALAAEMRVSKIVTVEVMEDEPDLVGIIVNLADYNVGADKGGEVNLFDDFDIDYNQYKYLIETRISGALVKIKSAMLIKKTSSTNVLVAGGPTEPGFVTETGVITIPTKTGVVYKDGSPTGATLTAGAQTALTAGSSKTVYAVPATGYYFENNERRDWTFKRPSA